MRALDAGNTEGVVGCALECRLSQEPWETGVQVHIPSKVPQLFQGL